MYQNGDPKMIDLFHGYTYSAHPLAAAALIATLDVYSEEDLFERASQLTSYWESALHSLKGMEHVIDIRNLGFVGGVEMSSRDDQIGARGYDVFETGFNDENILLRFTGDIIALSPPLIAEKKHIDRIIDSLRKIILNN
jgi:beta-alanine--pyruvate transaminase